MLIINQHLSQHVIWQQCEKFPDNDWSLKKPQMVRGTQGHSDMWTAGAGDRTTVDVLLYLLSHSHISLLKAE